MKYLDWQVIKPLFSKRSRNTSKSDYGHILVIGGDSGMSGAVRMAGEAALRVGAGLVSIATHTQHVAVVSAVRPELMCHGVETINHLEVLIARATLLVIGPGLGQSAWSRALFKQAMAAPQPKIIDADGLNLLAQTPRQGENWVLTPHPGEAARLLACTVSDIQNDRQGAVMQLQTRYGGTIVLKGMGTLVYNSDREMLECPAGNPGMASGGMGDVLSGVIGGLAAQQWPLATAAQAGVLIHSLAADEAARTHGERGLLASDLFPYLRALVNANDL